MSKRLYLTLFLGLVILLSGYYYASLMTEFWTIRICQILSIVLSGFFIIGFNHNSLPVKSNNPLRLILIVPIIIGVVGLIILNHSIPYLVHSLLNWDWPEIIPPSEENQFRFLIFLVVGGVAEEIYFRRIIAQKIFNSKGISKAIWISALVFSIAHWFGNAGLLYIFIGGLVLGYIYFKTKSLWMSIFAHLSYNLLIYFTSSKMTEQISQFNSTPKIVSIIFLGLILLICMTFLLNYLIKGEVVKKKPVANNTYSK